MFLEITTSTLIFIQPTRGTSHFGLLVDCHLHHPRRFRHQYINHIVVYEIIISIRGL
jgi:hypothetical protein